MILGFTGTRYGMTTSQHAWLKDLLTELQGRKTDPLVEVHHGACMGADEECHTLCLAADISVVLHPPGNPRYRATCDCAVSTRLPAPYLVRNAAIVDASSCLVAMPWEAYEPSSVRAGGTWWTVRYARRRSHVTSLLVKHGGH